MLEVGIGELGAVLLGMLILSGIKRAKIDLSRLG
jgi:hypothetical protein